MPSKKSDGLDAKTIMALPVLKALFDEVGSVERLEVLTIQFLLLIAHNGKTLVSDLETKLGCSSSTATYQVALLTEGSARTKSTGLRFCKAEVGFPDRRQRVISLTPKGQHFLDGLAGILEQRHGSSTPRK